MSAKTLDQMAVEICNVIKDGKGTALLDLARRNKVETDLDLFVFYLASRSLRPGKAANAARAALRAVHRMEAIEEAEKV